VNQSTLFHDTVYDAIGADIAAAGGFKVVAGKLWPSEGSATASAKLRNAINPDQPHKLCPDEVLAIKRLAKEAGSTATVDYEAMQLGFQVTWVDPADQAEELQRRIADGMDTLTKMVGQLQKVQERAALKAVR
jgi:NAD-dependent oxidoreductase involved in siderophore biosynthesis